MPRKLARTVRFTRRQVDELEAEASRLGVNFAEMIRRLLDRWVDQREKARS